MCHVVAPGGVFVVGRVGPQAAVEDAAESVGELAQCGVVADVPVAEGLVVGAGSWLSAHRAQGPLLQGVGEPALACVAGEDDLLLARGSGDR